MLDCAAKGVHGLVVVSAGFAETGEAAGVSSLMAKNVSKSTAVSTDGLVPVSSFSIH